MTSREGMNRGRLRQTAPIPDQVFTPLGRGPSTLSSNSNSSNLNSISSTTVVQNSGNVRLRHPTNPNANLNPITNTDLETNSKIETGIFDTNNLTTIITFDPEVFRTEIKTNHGDTKRIEQLILNAINYFLSTSKRSSQQIIDYTVLTFLAWTASLHGSIFRFPSIIKAMCMLFKGLTSTKSIKTLPTNNSNNNNNNNLTSTTPYTLLCQILWLAYKDQNIWPDEFIELYVDDALGEQNWIKNPDCQLFVANIQTAFHTRPSTWQLDRPKIVPNLPTFSTTTTPSIAISTTTTTQILSNLIDDTSNDSNINSESLGPTESESSLQIIDDSLVQNNSDHQLVYPRYEGRKQAIQNLLQTLLVTNAKIKSTAGNPTNLNSTNPNSTTSNPTSQTHETDKLLSLLEQLCGLPDIRLYILSRLENWLQNHKLTRTSEKLMITLCENLTKPPLNSSLTNGHETSYIDERAIEQLVNLRFKVRASNATNKMYILCIREMLKNDVNLVDLIVRFVVHNELQQNSPSISTKNPNNLPLLYACCQSQPEATCQSLAYTIQNILLLTNVTTTSKDYDNLLKSIRPFLRDLMRYAKNDFDPMKFSMDLIDMHYSNNLQQQFWIMIHQSDPVSNEITSHRLLKRLLDCDMSTRERFLYAICDLLPMIILTSAQAFNSSSTLSNPPNSTSTTQRSSSTNNIDQWLIFIQRIAWIQCSACLFFLFTLPRIFDTTITINYVPCLYSILFTALVNSYLRIENWPPEEPLGFRNELFRLSSEIPVLGETLYLLIQIGLTSHFRISSSIIIDLIDIIIRRTLNIEQKMPNDYFSHYLRIPENNSEIFLKKIFDLTRYHYPTQIQFPIDYQIPKNLSITDIFWKTCLICLLLASHDPQTFGRYIWLSIPQIRLFMEMLLTGDYTYPPKSMIEKKNFLEKFYLNEKHQLREEKDLLLEFEKYLAAPKIIDETNSQLLGKVLFLDLQQIKRPISQDKNEKHFYNLIQGLNNTYKLSSMLCRCRSPDFILDILNRQDQQGKIYSDNQTSWLTSLIDSNIDCLHVFPIICLCDYFQHMILILKQKTSQLTKKTYHALETILLRFKTILLSVQQQLNENISQSTQIDEFLCILNYFFNCLNSNISNIRTNAWLCLTIIFEEHCQTYSIEHLLNQTTINIELILLTISKFQSIEKTQSLIKQTLIETCRFETNISFLHYSLIFILNHCQIQSNHDEILLANLSRILIRRQTIFYLLIQYDKEEKACQLIDIYFRLICSNLLHKLAYALVNPIEIISNASSNESSQTNTTQTYLILENFNVEQKIFVEKLATQLNLSEKFSWKIDSNKQYLPIDRILIEILIIFLAYFDLNQSNNQHLNILANLIQEFLLEKHSSLVFTTLKQMSRMKPIRQRSDQNQKDDNHFEQFSIEDNEPTRKRRLSQNTTSEKVFLSSTNEVYYESLSINNQTEQYIFHSDYLQYFLLKSNHFLLVKQCIDQATLLTCLKMLRISMNSKENIDYLCQRINQLIDSSTKSLQTYFKQSNFILPLVNRWIREKLPEAIKLGDKLKKYLEKKKKYPILNEDLIPTTSRSTCSISDQIQSFDQQIDEILSTKLSTESSNNDQQMDVSELDLNFPWKTSAECEQCLRYIIDEKSDRIKRHQYLIQSQWLIHQSETHRSQVFSYRKCFEQSKIFIFLLKNYSIDGKQISNDKSTIFNWQTLLANPSLLNNIEFENDFYRLTKDKPEEMKEFLIQILVENEYQLTESTIGMILDRLDKLDNQSLNSSVYSNLRLFSQRTHTPISQRLLLKQFLHSCPWSTILTSISNLLTSRTSSFSLSSFSNTTTTIIQSLIPRISLSYSKNFDSSLILDMLEAFIKLSPLWSSREYKMFNRCHEELLIDLNSQQIQNLIYFILDEGEHLSDSDRFQRYQKRYDNLLSYLIQKPEKKSLFPQLLQKLSLDYQTIETNLQSFYFILYINQMDLFSDEFYLNFTRFRSYSKEFFHLSTNIDTILHDLFNRLNSYDLIVQENFQEINFLLKQYLCQSPLIFLRYLSIIKLNLQSRFSTINVDEFTQKNSKIRQFFLLIFDLIYRLKPFVYDEIYDDDFQSILDIYLRLINIHLNLFKDCTKQNLHTSICLQDYIYLIDGCLILIYDYFFSRNFHLNTNSLVKLMPNKFIEKLQEKIQTNQDFYQYLFSNRNYQILYYLKQLKILFESIKIEQIQSSRIPFDVHLCLTNYSKKTLDFQHYRQKLSYSIEDLTSANNLEEIFLTLNELKSQIDTYLPIEHLDSILDLLKTFLLFGTKQLIDQTYEFLFKYLNKYPQHANRFYSIYIQCLLSSNLIVFQIASEHFPKLMIFFQKKSKELFSLILRQGLINKIDVTSSITQAIRLLNLHRYDPITYTNSSLTTGN